MKRPDSVIFKKFLMSLSPEDLDKYLTEYENAHKVQVKERINKLKQEETQAQLEVLHTVTECPFCHSTMIRRYGTVNSIQRYQCKGCNSTFTPLTDTFMEGVNLNWEVWVKLLQMTMNTYSLDEIVDTLEKDYNLQGINRKTIFLLRHKLIYALSLMPKQKLSGVIQVDETFFRENQKGTRTDLGKSLINVIPKIVEKRLPRKGYTPSRLGTLGPEYACVVCAVDNQNHAVSIVTSLGKLEPKVFTDCFDDYFENVTYLCSDGSPIYDDYCTLKSIQHYIRPSTFVRTLMQAGYTSGVSADDKALSELYEKNRKLANKLYNDGLLDYIEYSASIPFADFCKIKKEYGLNLSRVNAFHNYLKLALEKETTGVATKYLPMYVDAYTFLYNWRHDHNTTLTSLKDAEIVLKELIRNKNAFTLNDLKKKDFFVAPTPTGKYLELLDKKTKEMRRETDNKFFKFDEEDRVISFDQRKYLRETSVGKLRPFGKEYNIKGYSRMSHWQLYSAIMELPKDSIGKIVCKLIAEDKQFNIYTEDLKFITAHNIPESELTYSKGSDLVDLERLFILKGEETEEDADDISEEDYPF